MILNALEPDGRSWLRDSAVYGKAQCARLYDVTPDEQSRDPHQQDSSSLIFNTVDLAAIPPRHKDRNDEECDAEAELFLLRPYSL